MKPFLMSHAVKADARAVRELTDAELDFISGGDEAAEVGGPGTFTRTLRDGKWHDDGIVDDSSHGPI